MEVRRTGGRRFLVFAAAAMAAAGTGCADLGGPASEVAAAPGVRRIEALELQKRSVPDTAAGEAVSVEQRLREGATHARAGDLSQAFLAFARAHWLEPDNPEPARRIAYLELRNDPERSARIFEDLLRESPKSAELLTGLGVARYALGDWEAAREALEAAVDQAPEAAFPRSSLGVVCDRLGHHERAQEHYTAALEHAPGDPEILNNLGVSFLLLESWQEAAAHLERAVQQSSDPAIRMNLGLAYGRLGRYGDALRMFRETGSEGDAQNNLGWIYYQNGRPREAIAHYERALLAGDADEARVLANLQAAQELLDVSAAGD